MANGKKILIVDDEALVRDVLSMRLAGEGFTVFEAANGKEGLEQAFKNHPDLILLDLIMPQVDGIELLKTIRQDPWGKTAHIIVMTNLNDAKSVEDSVTQGVRDYLVKVDQTPDEMVRIVKDRLK